MARKYIIAGALLGAMLMAPLADAQRGRRSGAPPPQEQRGGGGENRGGNRASGPKQKGKHSGDWLRRYSKMPPEQQEKALNGDPDFQRLPPPAQQRLRDRLRWFNELPRDRQEKILKRMDSFGHMTPEQQARARQLFEQQRALPRERHRVMRLEFDRLEPLSPAERRRAMESEAFRSSFTEHERQLLGEMLRLADEVEATNVGNRD